MSEKKMIMILGLIDVLIAVLAALMSFGPHIDKVMYVAGVYLILKGLLFINSIVSILDILAGVILLIGIYVTLPAWAFWIVAIFLIQKGIFSLF